MTLIHPDQYNINSVAGQFGINLVTKCPFCKSGAKFSPRWKSSINPPSVQQTNVPCSSCDRDVAFFLVLPNVMLPDLAKTPNQFYMHPHSSTEIVAPALKGGEEIPSAIRKYYSKVVESEALGDAHTASSNCRLALEGLVKEQLKLPNSKKNLHSLIKDLMGKEILNDNLANLAQALRKASNSSHHYSEDGPQDEINEIADMAQATAAVIDFFYVVPLLTKKIMSRGDNDAE